METKRPIGDWATTNTLRAAPRLAVRAGVRQACLAACLLAGACGEGNGPTEPTGQLRVSVSTTGLSVDPDGYTVVLDGSAGQPIQVNGTLLLEGVEAGNHTLTLAGVANNCHFGEQQPVTVLVSAGKITEASFTVTCDESGRLAFVIRLPGEAYDDIWVINADGTGRTRLTQGLGAVSPRWSPDGLKLAYVLTADTYPFDHGIGVMNADGTNPITVWQEPGGSGAPSWSPDSRRLVFAFDHSSGGGFYTMNADGSDVQWLTNGSVRGRDPAWSPDGSKIAFVQSRYGSHGEWEGDDIFIMSPDGSGVTRLTSGDYNNYERLAWSPDGTEIAYHTPILDAPYRKSAVRIFPLDGSAPPYQGDGLVEDGYVPAWSPGGSMIAYVYNPYYYDPDNPRGIYLIRPDATRARFLTFGTEPTWGP